MNEYIGGGELATLVAEGVEVAREIVQARRDEMKYTFAAPARFARRLDEWSAGVEAVAVAVLVEAGYHSHKGTWRRKRMSSEIATKAEAQPAAKPAGEDFGEVLDRLRKGDKEAIPVMRRLLKSGDKADAKWFRESWGNCSKELRDALVRMCTSDKDLIRQVAFRDQMRVMQEEIQGPNPTPLEKLLAERVVYSHFLVCHHERVYAKSGEISFVLANHYRRVIDSAHKRLLQATLALAKVRRLALPPVQVNIGKNQVNVNALGE